MESVDAVSQVLEAEVNDVSLHVAEQSPAAGPAVLLLHSFLELWLSWRLQMAALVARGFRALAPNLHGGHAPGPPPPPQGWFFVVLKIILLLPRVYVIAGSTGHPVWINAMPHWEKYRLLP